VPIRPFRPEDAKALAALSRDCSRGEADFVLNPAWEEEDELSAEFARFGIDPGTHLLVADAGDGEVQGLVGFLRGPGDAAAGMLCPIVRRGARGRGVGGELLRAALARAPQHGIRLLTAGVGTRNRAGYSLLTSHGFRPVRQTFLMRCPAKPGPQPPLPELSFEPARDADADAIHEIYAGCGFPARSPEAMRAALSDGRHAHAVALRDGNVVAFAELETHWPRRPWVAYVGVVKELRDRGVGSSLVSWALARRFEGGASFGQLLLSPANRTALRAYDKVGFRRFRLIDILEKSV
jgi:ribosomal protein S18 acetylase RimI-like enzyme